MNLSHRMKQLFYYSFSNLLIAIIAVYCLKMDSNNLFSGYPLKSKIACQFNPFIASANSCKNPGNVMKSTPHMHTLVLREIVEEQVYTPNKTQGKASNIKKNLSLARLTIVTA